MRQTSFEEVKQIAASGQYRLIPVSREIFSDIRTPVSYTHLIFRRRPAGGISEAGADYAGCDRTAASD